MSKIEVNGNNNQLYHKVKKSRINTDGSKTNSGSGWKWVGLVSLIVAIIGLIIEFIVGWDTIVKFFK